MRRTGDLKFIQELNRSIILDAIRQLGPISRSDLAQKNNLSPTTVTAAVNELIQEGLVCEDGFGTSKGGRKPILVRFSPDSQFLIGISIRSSTITIAEMNLEAKVRRKQTYAAHGYYGEQVIDFISDITTDFIENTLFYERCIGISIISQGIVNSSKGVILLNTKMKMKDIQIKKILEERFKKNVWLDNDTNAYILAEKQFGDYQKYQNIVYITIGDGVGAGILLNGDIYRGHNGSAGELGHTSIDRGGIQCECGNKGCLENYISWPAIFSRIISAITNGKESIMEKMVKGQLTDISPAIFRKAVLQEDELALTIMNETIHYLSTSLVNLVNLCNPHAIILGGEVVYQNPVYIEKVKQLVNKYTIHQDYEICSTSLGEEFEMIGAASVLLQDKFQFSFTTTS
ncbi:ROK family protein [Halalkalibacter kiskunsagensis]|uniref:ROK family protein n=1 Tax=Halalkalibacter kiskunsagensis TaxID=1548599 RepID=A0ABV6KBT5_9BACI